MQSEYYGTFENLSKSFLSSSGRISEWDYLKAFEKRIMVTQWHFENESTCLNKSQNVL